MAIAGWRDRSASPPHPAKWIHSHLRDFRWARKRNCLAVIAAMHHLSGMRTWIVSGLALLLGTAFAEAGVMEVVALHPLMADLARQVGGERVQVLDLVGEGGNPHRFEPRPADLKQMQASALVLASGKNLEPYLDRLRSRLSGVTIVEVGRTIPSLTVGKDRGLHLSGARRTRSARADRSIRIGGTAWTTCAAPHAWWPRRWRRRIPPARNISWPTPWRMASAWRI